MRTLVLLLAALALVPVVAQVGGQRWQADIRLYGAAFSGDVQDPDWPVIVLELERTGPRWERVFVRANDFSRFYDLGRVTGSVLSPDMRRATLDIVVPFARNRYSQGGYGAYRVALDIAADGAITGSYTGEFRGIAVTGKVEGRVVTRTAPTAEGYVPVKPGEHPRILFRKADLPALKEKLQTPMGQALFAQMKGPAGLGLKYQLTGDKALAEAAIPEVDALIRKGLISNQYGDNIERAAQVALAYDMCYDAWTPAYKAKVERYLAWIMDMVLYAHNGKTSRGINWHVSSNWSAPIYTGAGFAGLALWGEAGRAPVAPVEPPPAEVAPGVITRGLEVPIAPFASDVMPGEWLYAGPFNLEPGDDPLAAKGGPREFAPGVGAELTHRATTRAFALLSHEKDKGYYAPDAANPAKVFIDINHAVGREMFTTSYFYTVIRNDAERWVQVGTDYGEATVYLAGVRMREGDCVKIGPGLYPLLVEASFDWMNDWGRALLRPRLIEITAEEATQRRAARQTAYERARAEWQYDMAEFARLGGDARRGVGISVEYRKLAELSWRMLFLFCREAVGTGGEQSEISHYGGIAYGGPARFATAYKAMFGRDISPYDDITMVLPRKMFMHHYGVDGKDRALEINSEPEIWPDGWGGHFSGAFFTVPDRYKPAVLWAWNRASGVTPAKDGVPKGDPVYTFLYYPLDLEPKHPKEVMPLTWQAPDFGFYGFRNSWEGTDDIICTTWLRAHTIGGWNGPNAGTFRLYGFGQVWAWGPHDRNRMRWEENVVQLPDNPEINEGALGRLTYLKTEPDGSGSLSMDLNDVYAGATEPRKPQYSRYGNFRYAPGFADTGITGMRALAVDYSGLSGAPCLLVLVDRIDGGKTKVWTWNLERGDGKKVLGDLANTNADGRNFTIAKAGATLKGTFVSPSEVKLTAETKPLSMKGGAGSSAGKDLAKPIPGIFAESADGRFFCIVTLQRGPAPEVKVAGEGLNATVTVGKRTVKFDGDKVVFGVTE